MGENNIWLISINKNISYIKEVNEKMTPKDVENGLTNVKTAINTGKVIAKYVSNTSLTKLAKDSIFQFPVIISASIDND